jgi:hypothetical protein
MVCVNIPLNILTICMVLQPTIRWGKPNLPRSIRPRQEIAGGSYIFGCPSMQMHHVYTQGYQETHQRFSYCEGVRPPRLHIRKCNKRGQ